MAHEARLAQVPVWRVCNGWLTGAPGLVAASRAERPGVDGRIVGSGVRAPLAWSGPPLGSACGRCSARFLRVAGGLRIAAHGCQGRHWAQWRPGRVTSSFVLEITCFAATRHAIGWAGSFAIGMVVRHQGQRRAGELSSSSRRPAGAVGDERGGSPQAGFPMPMPMPMPSMNAVWWLYGCLGVTVTGGLAGGLGCSPATQHDVVSNRPMLVAPRQLLERAQQGRAHYAAAPSRTLAPTPWALLPVGVSQILTGGCMHPTDVFSFVVAVGSRTQRRSRLSVLESP